VEVIEELVFVVETTDFKQVINKLQRFGGHTEVIQLKDDHALLSLPSGPRLRIARASERDWGYVLLRETGSATHLSKLEALPVDGLEGSLDIRDLGSEEAVYECLHMHFIEPEIREGRDEVQRAKAFALPELVREDEIRGDLHAHTIASDGSHSIEQMARQARERGYEYLGITDHSQSLKIAGGVSIDDL
jgi:DNA polymerase (family 10)